VYTDLEGFPSWGGYHPGLFPPYLSHQDPQALLLNPVQVGLTRNRNPQFQVEDSDPVYAIRDLNVAAHLSIQD
jgi:hypothetical protein